MVESAFAPEAMARLEEVSVGLGPDANDELRGRPRRRGASRGTRIPFGPPRSERPRSIAHPAEESETVREVLLRRDPVERRLARRFEVVRDAVAQIHQPVDREAGTLRDSGRDEEPGDPPAPVGR